MRLSSWLQQRKVPFASDSLGEGDSNSALSTWVCISSCFALLTTYSSINDHIVSLTLIVRTVSFFLLEPSVHMSRSVGGGQYDPGKRILEWDDIRVKFENPTVF